MKGNTEHKTLVMASNYQISMVKVKRTITRPRGNLNGLLLPCWGDNLMSHTSINPKIQIQHLGQGEPERNPTQGTKTQMTSKCKGNNEM